MNIKYQLLLEFQAKRLETKVKNKIHKIKKLRKTRYLFINNRQSIHPLRLFLLFFIFLRSPLSSFQPRREVETPQIPRVSMSRLR